METDRGHWAGRNLRVRVLAKRGLRQRFHVRVENRANGRVLLWSEKYRTAMYARIFGGGLAEVLGAEFQDDTVGYA